jgi:chitinase
LAASESGLFNHLLVCLWLKPTVMIASPARKIFVCLLFFSITIGNAYSQSDLKVIAYCGRRVQLDSVDVTKLTHMIFSFGHLKGNRFHIDRARDTAFIQKMVALKSKNPNLKILLSLGGWGGCETCSDVFSTAAARQEFAVSVKEVNDYLKTDGIDLDWEYPSVRLDNDIDTNPVHKTSPEDTKNFTDVVARLRKTLGKKMIISFAAGGFQTYLDKAVEWKKVMKMADFVNLMTYDLINGYATVTGHHTALYSTPKQHESTDNAVQYLLKLGIDSKQLVIGTAFYARVWENVSADNNGLYQTGKFKTSVPYKMFSERLSADSGFVRHWDETAQAPYMYNAEKKLFATFDDEQSIATKTKYAKEHRLGGLMFWELSLDKPADGLIDVISREK